MVVYRSINYPYIAFKRQDCYHGFEALKPTVKEMTVKLSEYLWELFGYIMTVTSVWRKDKRSQHSRYEAVDVRAHDMTSEISNHAILFCLTRYPRQDTIKTSGGRQRNALSCWPHGKGSNNHLHLSQDKT